jgi:adenine-specific DNA methylase
MAQDRSFIEVQFPVSKVSKESYKERKAVQSQTLTGLGKWWGRKPLVLVRAAILGLLMPASDDAKKDMDIFLKIMTMDKKGLLHRKSKAVSAADVFNVLTSREKEIYFVGTTTPKWKDEITADEKMEATNKAWNRLTYDKKLAYCVRPEEAENIDISQWKEINTHLSTSADDLQELIEQLGIKKFGHRAVVGDCFCGGGSIPFEAARMGNDVFGSDLNPIAGLLTWADLNIADTSDEEIENLRVFQQKVYDEVDKKVLEWGIESNEDGDRANVYLYCTETICPECHYKLPLVSSWVVGVGSMTIATPKDNGLDGFDIEIESGVTSEQLKSANELVTVKNGSIFCPHCKKTVPISALRKDTSEGYGLRQWNKDEFTPRNDDTFKERLYCVRYTHQYVDKNGKIKSERYYTAPTEKDFEREQKVKELLSDRFKEWQKKGYIPSNEVEDGNKTNEIMRTRGWTHWHQLFNARQLLMLGLIQRNIDAIAGNTLERVIGLLLIHRCCDWNSKLCRWGVGQARESMAQTFYNQAFNTMWEYGSRALPLLQGVYELNFEAVSKSKIKEKVIKIDDARIISNQCDLWITDPPYADAVNYHELSEFFLAWDKKLLKKAFPEWYTDSKRVLAVKGREQSFKQSMVEIYTNSANNMPDNGLQIIMFTHQDVSVWADLAFIVWSAGLQVTAAWNIATETEASGLKDGNYVKGTVLLVLRKQTSTKSAYLDEIYPDIEEEVKKQIDSMRSLDDKEEPNFSDADYILAAYAAALKVLTSVKRIEDIDVEYELSRDRKNGELSPVAKLIESATKIAYDQLIPADFDSFIWRSLSPDERLYIKGLELEKNNIYQVSGYQELARGFGVNEYKDFMESSKANAARLKTPKEWANRNIGGEVGFGVTLLRNVLMAIYLAEKEDNVQSGKNWLKNEVSDYWNKREQICEFLNYISTFEPINNMEHWQGAAKVAGILKELVKNDGV